MENFIGSGSGHWSLVVQLRPRISRLFGFSAFRRLTVECRLGDNYSLIPFTHRTWSFHVNVIVASMRAVGTGITGRSCALEQTNKNNKNKNDNIFFWRFISWKIKNHGGNIKTRIWINKKSICRSIMISVYCVIVLPIGRNSAFSHFLQFVPNDYNNNFSLVVLSNGVCWRVWNRWCLIQSRRWMARSELKYKFLNQSARALRTAL